MARGRLRLRTWRREELEAGVVVLLSLLVGGLVFFQAFLGSGGGGGDSCLVESTEELLSIVGGSDRPVAVMFSSDTCPVCRQMEPYWRELCARDDLGAVFLIFKLNDDTVDYFLESGVTETPTFMVYVNGKPVARHVGGFTGSNITQVMLEWVLSQAGGGWAGDYRLLERSCSSCHPLPESLTRDAIAEWLRSNPDDELARAVAGAVTAGGSVSQLYGGTQGLVGVILEMNSSLTPGEAARIAGVLDLMPVIARGAGEATSIEEQGPEAGGGEEAGAAVTAATTFLAGLIAAFSPCVFPLLLTYVSSLATGAGGRRLGSSAAIKAFAAAAAGTLAIGLLFVALGDVVARASGVLLPTAALVLFSAGLLGYLDVPTFVNVTVSSRRGLLGFSFIYGVLAVQCSFPLVAGALLLLASGGLSEGAPGLAAFTLGIAAPVALAVYASGREELASLLNRLASKEARRYTSLLLAVMGLYLLLYSLGLV